MTVQAGAITVRGSGANVEVLIVRPKRSATEWIFPKGHVEKGESLAETAVRELREEAGVDGKVVDRVGESTFKLRGDTIHVTYFLVRAHGLVPPAERREIRWCRPADARALLTFDNLKRLVDLVERLLA
jgi:8-oxo-dGTP pyrophosphatase MutT (NUDIX family)